MAEFIHVQSGSRVSVADGKVLGPGFVPAEKPQPEKTKPEKKQG